MPKNGLVNALLQRRALRQLIDGELVHVRIRNADAGDLRAKVSELNRDVRRRARAGARRSTAERILSPRSRSTEKTPCPRPASGVRPSGATARTVRKRERGPNVVQRSLRHGLQEWKDRRRKRRRDARHLNPDERVPGAEHGLVRQDDRRRRAWDRSSTCGARGPHAAGRFVRGTPAASSRD